MTHFPLITVSIHAPVRGATHDFYLLNRDSGFNPRPRAGGDGDIIVARFVGVVSIHAPVRGATLLRSERFEFV